MLLLMLNKHDKMLSYKLAIPQKKWCQKATSSCFQTHKQEEKPKLPRTRQLKNLAWLSQKKAPILSLDLDMHLFLHYKNLYFTL
jgi:hypothetical protein